MIKLLTFCCNCGYGFGRSACGTQTELYCPKCGAEIEYTVGENSVAIQMSGKFVDQQKMRIRRNSKNSSENK